MTWKTTITLLLALAMLLGLCACGQSAAAPAEDANDIPTELPAEDSPTPTATPEPAYEYSETERAEMALLAEVDYSRHNFLTEAEFYELLAQMLALHDVEMTRYPGDTAYFYYNYSNAQSVKFLTVAKTMEEIEADRVAAQEDLLQAAGELAKEQAALERGYIYEAPEEDPAAEETPLPFDAAKDVENSEDYVVSFVISATKDAVDQELMFLTASCAWAILHPDYSNTADSFAYLWRGLFTTYGNSGGLSASTIAGFAGAEESFRIPGNALEAWMDEDENGNYIVALTLYAEYDDIIELESMPSMMASLPITGG